MTISELKQEILHIILDTYGKCYVKRLEVKRDGSMYFLELYLHHRILAPLQIGAQCSSDEEFLNFIKKELADRQLIMSDFVNIELKNGRDF